MTDCFFCGETKFSLNKAVNLPCGNSVIYCDENVFIVPDIAPLVKGHFLVVTHEHLLSFAEASDSVIESLEKAKRFLLDSVFKTESAFFFEHGSVWGLSSCDCVEHAHLHALPISFDVFDVDDFIKKSGYVNSSKLIASRSVLSKLASDTQPYVYYETGADSWVYPIDRIPSQFFREIIASRLKIKHNYNWKLTFKEEMSKRLFNETLEMASPFLK